MKQINNREIDSDHNNRIKFMVPTLLSLILIIIIIIIMTHIKLLWDFDILTDYLISARRPDLIIINKKKKKRTCKIVDFAVLADHKIKLKEC